MGSTNQLDGRNNAIKYRIRQTESTTGVQRALVSDGDGQRSDLCGSSIVRTGADLTVFPRIISSLE